MKIDIDNQEPIVRVYGIKSQSIIWLEELSELAQAVSKCCRDADGETVANMTEEIADVLICIEQMRATYGIKAADVQEVIYEKQERQKKRVAEFLRLKEIEKGAAED